MWFGLRQDVSALVSTLMAIVRTQGAGVSVAGAAAARGHKESDRATLKTDAEGGKQNARERVVLLMHETRVLSATDATRLLLLLAREVRRCSRSLRR